MSNWLVSALIAGLMAAGCSGSGVASGPLPSPRPAAPPVPGPPDALSSESVSLPTIIPSAPREFRAAWVASVANIDWPSEPGLPVERQQQEVRAILDQAVALNLNAIIFQVRPMADALYASDLEPWSYYLTGEQGVAPDPTYDPLAFWIEESHRRGLELHAWFNPFRAGHPTTPGYDSTHVSLGRPEWVKSYGELRWLDPGDPEARAHSLAVIADVTRRYDIDGVHLDDYFYPYGIRDSLSREVPFPDTTSWSMALAEGWEGNLPDWRRSNVDGFVEALYDSVRAIKPWVQVGISPFGIWRPGFPEEVVGFDAFEGLYADSRRWLREGWVDYFTPQLYWAISSPGQPYGALLDWWLGENVHGRHLWPGNYASRVILEGNARWEPDELVRQVRLTRESPGAGGNVHFSMRSIMDGPGADKALADSVYDAPALIPATPWLSSATPNTPDARLRRLGGRWVLDLDPGDGPQPFLWHVREWNGGEWTIRLEPAWRRQLGPWTRFPDLVVISAVDRLGMEGPARLITLSDAD